MGSNCHLVFDSNYYSVPFRYCGQEVTLQVTEKLVKIYESINPLSREEGQLVATHPRVRGEGKFQTNSSHYPSWKIVSKTEYQERYRQKMAAIGPEAERYFLWLVRVQGSYWSKGIHGVLSLARKYGPEAIELACKRALYYEAYGYRVIKNILEKRLHLQAWEEKTTQEKSPESKIQRPLKEYETLLY